MGKQWLQRQTLFSCAPKSLQMVTAALKLKRRLLLGRKAMTNLDSILKKQRHYFADKGPSSQSYGFSRSHIWMWELDHKKSWAPNFWTVVLEKTFESPLDCKEIQPVHSKGDQSWVFFGRNDAKAETPILCPPHVKSWLIGKDSDAGRGCGPEKGMTEDEMAGWHHRLNGRVWVDSGSWWWTGRPGVLWFMGLQRVGHDWATELTIGILEPMECVWVRGVAPGTNQSPLGCWGTILYTSICGFSVLS